MCKRFYHFKKVGGGGGGGGALEGSFEGTFYDLGFGNDLTGFSDTTG